MYRPSVNAQTRCFHGNPEAVKALILACIQAAPNAIYYLDADYIAASDIEYSAAVEIIETLLDAYQTGDSRAFRLKVSHLRSFAATLAVARESVLAADNRKEA